MSVMDQEQFSQLLLTLGLNIDDRKTLTRIEEKLSNHLDNYRREQAELSKSVALADQKAAAAHNRLDRIIGIGGWTVFFTVGGLILTVIFNLWTINERRFDELRTRAQREVHANG